MARRELPQNYFASHGELFQDFEDIGAGGWMKDSGAAFFANSQEFKVGTQSLKMTTTAGGATFGTKNISRVFRDQCMEFWLYCHTDPSTIGSFTIYLSSASNLTKHFKKAIGGSDLKLGWNCIRFCPSEWANVGNEAWADTMTRMHLRLDAAARQVAAVSIDDCRMGWRAVPQVLFTFDDVWSSAYLQGLSYMTSKGLRGTWYVAKSKVGLENWVTLEQMADAYSKGWGMANHTVNHPDLTSRTEAEIRAEIGECTDWLDSMGYSRAARHMAYPQGSSNVVTRNVAQSLGILTGRTTISATQKGTGFNPYTLKGRGVSRQTLGTVKGWIDAAIADHETCVLTFHGLDEALTNDTDWRVSDFRSVVDYVIQKRVRVPTIDEWWEGLTNPRYRSVPLNRQSIQPGTHGERETGSAKVVSSEA